jgi:hypothetical protein
MLSPLTIADVKTELSELQESVVEVLGVPQRPLGVVSIGPVCAVSHAT